jgi:hypothetical protein
VKNNKIDKHLLNLAGKHRVCSELNKLNMHAKVSYEKRKSGDVHAIRKNRTALKIEVRASQEDRFLTRIDGNRPAVLPAPDFWVLVQFQPRGERFFVFSNEEICALQRDVNGKYMKAHPRTNPKGVPNVGIEDCQGPRTSVEENHRGISASGTCGISGPGHNKVTKGFDPQQTVARAHA